MRKTIILTALTFAFVLCFITTGYSTPEEYYFENLSFDSEDGFKTVDDRFLVSEGFESYSGMSIFYIESGSHASGIIIKPDGENLSSFDLLDMRFGQNEGIFDTGIVAIEIEATLNTGSSFTRSVTGNVSLAGSGTLNEMGMNMTPFNDVVELSLSISTPATGISVWDILFESITIDDENPPSEMVIKGNGSVIQDGDTTPRTGDNTLFGSADIATGSITETFVIENTGTGRLMLTDASPYVTMSGDTSDFSLVSSPDKVVSSGDDTVFTIRFNPSETGTRTVIVSIANDDADKNPYNFTIRGEGYRRAEVVNITSTSPDTSYGDGDFIDITVEFDNSVVVNGAPQLALETGAIDAFADYLSGSGTAALTFRYVVASIHRSTDLSYQHSDALLLNGGTISDTDGHDVLLTLPAPGSPGSLSYSSNLYIITPGFAVSETNGGTRVGESGLTDTFSVVLSAQPDSDVVISVSCSDLTEAMVDTDSLIFTSGNWNSAQTVTVMGVNDAGDDGDVLSVVTLSIDDRASNVYFDDLPDQMIDVLTEDNDSAGFVVTETGGDTTIDESGTDDTFSVVLTAQPDSDVVLVIENGDAGEAVIDVSGLTFTDANWDIAQIVTVTGVDDRLFDGAKVTDITIRVNDAVSDDTFDDLADRIVSVTTTDDDVDTDNDGMSDEWEITHGFDPDTTDDGIVDTDGDGLSNLEEYQNGTNPNSEDSDEDGLSDSWEVVNGYDPIQKDSDADGIEDGEEDPDSDGVNNIFEEMLATEPFNADSDGNGIDDGDEDPDADGITTMTEILRGLDPGMNEFPEAIVLHSQQTVDEDISITLDGSGSSDPDDGIASWQWSQTNEPDIPLTITNADQAVASFISPQVDLGGTSFEFTLTVTDNAGQSASVTCIINVTWDNTPPVANAGENQEVNAGDRVQLDCTGSTDVDGEIVSFFWEQTGGIAVEAFDSSSATPSFMAPYSTTDELLVFNVTVTDQEGLKSVDTIVITVRTSATASGENDGDGGGSGGGSGCFINMVAPF